MMVLEFAGYAAVVLGFLAGCVALSVWEDRS